MPGRTARETVLGRAFGTGLLALGVGACGADAGDPRPAEEPSVVSDAASDGRVEYLLAPCARGGYYAVATADVTPILEETLLHGHRDPLKRAKAELAAMDEEGLVVLRRIVRKYWNLPDGKSHVRNALEAAAMGTSPGARQLLLEGLEHAMEDLRLVSLRGLRKHGLPEDYDALYDALGSTSPSFYLEILATMHSVAPRPTEALVAGWLEQDQYEETWEQVIPFLASARAPEVVEICRERWASAPLHFQPSLAAPCARAGDPEAARALDAWLVDPGNSTLRRYAAQALDAADLAERLAPMLADDPIAENRLIAAGFMAKTPERTQRVRSYLLAGLSDEDSSVAQACMAGLIAAGDPAGLDAAMALLSDPTSGSLHAALRLLRGPMELDAELAQRVFDVVAQIHEAQEHRPLAERLRVLQGISQIPVEDAARLLHDLGRETTEPVQGRRAEQWFLLQVGNVGVAATPVLEAMLDEPLDEVRRIDVLEALAMRGGDSARESMLRFLERDDAGPFEVLYAADRLTRIGPARIVAPVLKRVTLRVVHPRVRPALECLLWSAYPGPR